MSIRLIELFLTKHKVDGDKKEKKYCDDDGKYHVCDKLGLGRDYNNHFKSQTHLNNFRGRQQLINSKKKHI